MEQGYEDEPNTKTQNQTSDFFWEILDAKYQPQFTRTGNTCRIQDPEDK